MYCGQRLAAVGDVPDVHIHVMRRQVFEALPVDEALPRLKNALFSAATAVLVAPPGAGKTTHVPLALLHESWLAGRKIIVLEPRRLAARAAAHRMAQLLGENVGETVGFRVRLESRIGRRTRVEVVTEGVLSRMIASDPTLDGVGLVIFDEFHERSVHADLGLALTLHARDELRDDLGVLVMSATLDGARVARLLGNAPVITSEGKAFPVETRYVPYRSATSREAAVVAAVTSAAADPGDILVFLPGAGEIRRVAEALQSRALPRGMSIIPLFGSMSLEDQDRAIQPSPAGTRKVVLATTIAQTSLTIEGIGVVIDSGYTRIPRYSPRTGMTRLETVRVSRAAADQRRGRAGRMGPGVCYRLWSAADEALLKPHDTPEILEADLAPLVLDLAVVGIADPAQLRWLDLPPEGATAHARELLRELGALDTAITSHGRDLAALGAHPRIAHMLITARDAGHGALACDLAALLEERDILGGVPHERDPDLRTRLDMLHGRRQAAASLQRLRKTADRWRDRLAVQGASDVRAAGWLLALAYPDRIAQRREGTAPRYVLRQGMGAVLPPGSGMHNEPYIVAAELDARGPESLILLAAPITAEEIEEHFADQIEISDTIQWDETTGSVSARRRRVLGAIVLADAPLKHPSEQDITRAIQRVILESDFSMLNWTRDAVTLRNRLAFLHAHDPEWPDVSNAGLRLTSDKWLAPYLTGLRRRQEILRISVEDAVRELLTWQQRAKLDQLAPTHIQVPSGSRIAVDYSDPATPVLAVKLQEVFGLTSTPTILAGRKPVTMHLLSPSRRPVQVTTDLASFWRTSYFDVRKELRGRYPKHPWPDDPLNAPATRRTNRSRP